MKAFAGIGVMILLAVVLIIIACTVKPSSTSYGNNKNNSGPESYGTLTPDVGVGQSDYLKKYNRDIGILHDTCMRSSSNITYSGSRDFCDAEREKNRFQLQTNNNILVPGMQPYIFEKQKCDQQFDKCNSMATSPLENEACRRQFAQCKAWAPTKGHLGVVYPTTYPVLAIKS